METFTFGKYKGQRVYDIIMTHIGYIYWCFDNLEWFRLTDEQQRLYDVVSLAINNQKAFSLPFPNHYLLKYVCNRDIENPLIMLSNGYMGVIRDKEHLHPYIKEYVSTDTSSDYVDAFKCLTHCMTKEIERSVYSDYNGDADSAYNDWANVFFDD